VYSILSRIFFFVICYLLLVVYIRFRLVCGKSFLQKVIILQILEHDILKNMDFNVCMKRGVGVMAENDSDENEVLRMVMLGYT